MKSTKVIARVMLALFGALAALLIVVPATTASATALQFTTSQDAQYLGILHSAGLYNSLGPSAEIAIGHGIASDVYYGVRTPYEEQLWVYRSTGPSITRSDSNVMVNGALLVYLGMPLPSASNGVDT